MQSGATYRDRVSETSVEAPSAPERTRSGVAWLYALMGVLAAGFGVAVGTLVAALIDAAYAPIEVVASTAIDLPPQAVKEWATSTFGTASKSVVVGVVVAAVIAIAAWAGAAARTRPAGGQVGRVVARRAGLGVIVMFLVLLFRRPRQYSLNRC